MSIWGKDKKEEGSEMQQQQTPPPTLAPSAPAPPRVEPPKVEIREVIKEVIKKVVLCPNCGAEVEGGPPCPECGFEPGQEEEVEALDDEAIRQAALQWFDDKLRSKGEPYVMGDRAVPDLISEMGITIQRGNFLKRDWLTARRKLKNLEEWETRLLEKEKKMLQQEGATPSFQMPPRINTPPTNYPQQTPYQPSQTFPQYQPNPGQYQPYPPNFPQQNPYPPVSDPIAPYKEQINQLREDLKYAREKADGLEKELRDTLKNPSKTPPDARFSKLEDAMMEKFVHWTLNPPQNNQKPDIVQSVIDGLTRPETIRELKGLYADMQNQGNPEYDPYANIPPANPKADAARIQQMRQQAAQRRAALQARQQAAPRAAPAPATANPPPSGVAQQPPVYQQPAPPPTTGQPPVYQQPELYTPSPTQQIVDTPAPDFENPNEAMELADMICENYPKIPRDIIEGACEKVVANSNPKMATSEKYSYALEVLKSISLLRDIGESMKRVMGGLITTQKAAEIVVTAYPRHAMILAQIGPDKLLDQADFLVDHPVHGKDIAFLARDDVRVKMREITTYVQAILQQVQARQQGQ